MPISKSTVNQKLKLPGSSLPPAMLPSSIAVETLSTPDSINQACHKILNDCENDLYVGFDCEWSGSMAVSLIQISLKDTVFLFRVNGFDDATLPQELQDVLRSVRIRKLGRNIKGDCTRIHRMFKV